MRLSGQARHFMKLIRKWLIVTHRYVGITLSLLFVIWFASGIAMLYARGMPRLTPDVRLARLAPVDPSAVRLSALEAVERADLEGAADQVTLLTVTNRPAYRFGPGRPTTIFADTGEQLVSVGVDTAHKIASDFMRLPEDRVRYIGTLTRPDQWTLTVRQGPTHKFAVDDAARTELYVSEQTAEVSVMTTRGSRMLAWVGAIPHWLYFAPLRLNATLWRQVVLWSSGVGIFLALLGIVLGIVQLRITRPFTLSRIWSYLPYTGWMRWHYVTGLVFGVFALTFVFSGWLSMEPWGWATGGGRFGAGLREAFTSSAGDLSEFPALAPSSWSTIAQGRAVKEIAFVRIQDDPFFVVRREPAPEAGTEVRGHEPYFAVRASDAAEIVVAAKTLQLHDRPFAADALLARVSSALPGTPIVESETLSTYDSYYYSRDGLAPLPVLRVKLGDPERTWLYIDSRMSQLVGRVHRLDRLERWLYNGLHSLDFSFWYYKRPLWDIGMILLSLGGLATSTIGFFVGFKRVFRGVGRLVPSKSQREYVAFRRT
jgi:PepSY-associated transmembrane protein